MDWKLPIAYFLLPDGFKSDSRAELLRQALQKLNETGAIVTNIVMDNCPVNYSTFRKLGCTLSRTFQELDTCTDVKNNLGKYVMALFDPPHLSKLGTFCSLPYMKNGSTYYVSQICDIQLNAKFNITLKKILSTSTHHKHNLAIISISLVKLIVRFSSARIFF
jgi:hypothetical protein